MIHTVRQGDYLSKIAHAHGFRDWRAIYDHPENADFRRLRPNPNLIYPGDRIFIPEREEKTIEVPTGSRQRFRINCQSNRLHLVLSDETQEPLGDVPYELSFRGQTIRATTDDQGVIDTEIPADLAEARLSIAGRYMQLRIGDLNPMDDTDDGGASGVQGRLHNLGYYQGPIDGELSEETRTAIRAFERDHELPELSDVNRLLKQRLCEVYGC